MLHTIWLDFGQRIFSKLDLESRLWNHSRKKYESATQTSVNTDPLKSYGAIIKSIAARSWNCSLSKGNHGIRAGAKVNVRSN